jgi:hypothetical protein
MDISIIGRSGEVVAVLVFKTKEKWVPMDRKDIGKTDKFLPSDIHEITISADDGTFVRIPLMVRSVR